MALTGRQISKHFYDLVAASSLASEVSGNVYYKEGRPRDSTLEDIEVIFTTGRTDQIQSGFVTILIYFFDVDPYQNGQFVEDIARAIELEAAAQAFAKSIKISRFKVSQESTITTYPVGNEVKQHFVSLKLYYQYF